MKKTENNRDALYTAEGTGTQVVYVILNPATTIEAEPLLKELKKRFTVYAFMHGKNNLYMKFFGGTSLRLQRAYDEISKTRPIDCIITDTFSIMRKSLKYSGKIEIASKTRRSLVITGKKSNQTHFLTYSLMKDDAEISKKLIAAGVASMCA